MRRVLLFATMSFRRLILPYRWLLLLALLTGIDVAHAQQYEETVKKHSWFSFSRPAKKDPVAQLNYAQDLFEAGNLKKAGKAFRALVMTWPGSLEAPKAQWALATTLDRRGKSIDAFDAYQALMENYPGRFPQYDQILARQFEIATNLMFTRKGQFLFMPGFEAPERAIPLLEKIVQNGPRSPHAAEAQFLIGQAYEQSFDEELAVVAYMATLHRYPLSRFAEPAAYGRARALHTISKNYPHDVQALEEAWTAVMVFLRAYPGSTYVADATAMRDQILLRRADQAFGIAYFYDRKAKRPDAARESYELFLAQYPKSPRSDEARERIAQLPAKKEPVNDETEKQ